MSVSVNNVTKLYGTQKALDKVSFEVQPGEIVGFLGPNGAGKSTMMKIITCFIPQNEGQVSVCGYDVEKDPLNVKENVGYLPEHNPLYLDMYVKEYLWFIAGLHKLDKKKDRVHQIIDLVGLKVEQNKQIGALSKGYRQRVGLAQALIHDPEVLILDEPTSGLDPNQIVDIRNLIQDIGKKKTVMMSTHIMQEVEAICDRVIIINKGKIVADDRAANLRNLRKNIQVIAVEFSGEVKKEQILQIAAVKSAEHITGNHWKIQADTKEDIRSRVFDFAVKNDLAVLTLQKEEQRLEDVFKEVTTQVK